MRKLILPGLVLLALSACSSVSQTRDEFRARVAAGQALSTTDTYVAKRGFEEVTKMLSQMSERCLNYQMTQSRGEGGMTTSSSTTAFVADFRVVSNNHAELTIHKVPKSKLSFAPGAPEGGLYYVAVDVDRLSPTTTKLTYYGPSGWDEGYGAIKNWSDGQRSGCPYT